MNNELGLTSVFQRRHQLESWQFQVYLVRPCIDWLCSLQACLKIQFRGPTHTLLSSRSRIICVYYI